MVYVILGILNVLVAVLNVWVARRNTLIATSLYAATRPQQPSLPQYYKRPHKPQ